MADATYQPKIYRAQGGAELVISASGTLTLEGETNVASGSSMTFESGSGFNLASGSSFVCATNMEMSASITMASGSSMTFASGSGVSLASGSSFSAATALEIASGGSVALASGSALTLAAGSYATVPVQSLAVADVATPVTAFGVSVLQASTTGPSYTMAAPTAAGQWKNICAYATSTGATHRLVLYSGSTGIAFSNCFTNGNTITLATSIGIMSLNMVATSATAWRVIHTSNNETLALSNKAT